MALDKAFRRHLLNEFKTVNDRHKNRLFNKGVRLPLPTVPFPETGLMKLLPGIEGKDGWPWNVEVAVNSYPKHRNWPMISIVIPSYNQGEFLEEAIRSVLLQNYPNLELIVMDGGSTDGSKEIIARYAPWLSYWQSEKDMGQGHAINMGFSIAGGDYFGWLNSDDFYNQRAFLILGAEILRSRKAFYYADAFSVNRDNSVQSLWKGFLVKDIFLRFGGLIASHSAFWERRIHQPVWEAINCNVDGELWIRLIKGQSRKHIKFPLGSVRLYSDTKSAHEKWKLKWREDDLNIEKIHGSPPGPRSIKAYVFRFIQSIYRTL